MKKALMSLLTILLCIYFSACTREVTITQSPEITQSPVTSQKTEPDDETGVRSLVKEFGSKLQNVSLLAPLEIIEKSMQENYGDLVFPELLVKWKSDPLNAPGRLTSSPWPDRIEILSMEKTSDDAYQVEGEIVEITSTEEPGIGAAARRQITLVVKKSQKRWLISDVLLGPYIDIDSFIYQNTQYGFRFTLPTSWAGYSIITEKWDGLAIEGIEGENVNETGPLLSIRHPQWTVTKPRQDIPIMVFTQNQWDQLQQEKFHIGAAPINPKELGHNEKYVFALPARYNYAFPEGFEEVDTIIESNPLQAEI